MAGDEQRREEIGGSYKIKVVSFFDRKVPIVLQNDNGPSPLLAICNIMSLRNKWNLNVDVSEVTQQMLLHLVGEWLLDAKSNAKNRNDEYVKNQLQNISDAIDLVPSLVNGIDVNVRFRNINDFESVPVCAIFDLLDIGLVHGWTVDPRDTDTATAIGSRSYCALEKLVSPEASERGHDRHSEEDYVDFVAATTATLGVPSPCLTRIRSFEDTPICHLCSPKLKGETEEVEQLMKYLELSKAYISNPLCIPYDTKAYPSGLAKPSVALWETGYLAENVLSNQVEEFRFCDGSDVRPSGNICESCTYGLKGDQKFLQADALDSSTSNMEKAETSHPPLNWNADQSSHVLVANGEHDISDLPLDANSILDGREPIYEGEDFVQDLALAMHEHEEPVYEGELLLAVQSDKEREGGCGSVPNDEGTQIQCLEPMTKAATEGELIRNFLANNASQLTIHGLFFLQERLKEHSLCVFFRNNHFSTMFKHEGQLYLLTTDLSYADQPDLVWERLNEVNGDTVFMTGNFEEFKIGNDTTDLWDEQNAMDVTE